MNITKIQTVKIFGVEYSVSHLTPITMAEFVIDVTKSDDLNKTLTKYGVKVV